MKRTILAFLLLFRFSLCYCQTDTEFWFAAPFISPSGGFDRPIRLVISTYDLPCNVMISQPANGGLPAQSFPMAANSTQSVDLTAWIDNVQCSIGDVAQNRGLKITSDNKISCYYQVQGASFDNTELFTLKGKQALGNEFYISAQTFLDNYNFEPAPKSSFDIVATEDNTRVTITPTRDIIGHSANTPFTIILNKGQTYAAIAVSLSAAQHLLGSFVSSDKLIAITLADDELYGTGYGGGCKDLAGDQTVPVNQLGTEYIAFKSGMNMPYDKIYITAVKDGTSVYQDGILSATINKGESTVLSVNNDVTDIKSSNPVYALQLGGMGCEMSEAILPKINCNGSKAVSFVRSDNGIDELRIYLVVKSGAQNSFLINGQPNQISSSQFNAVPNTNNQWYSAKILLSPQSYPYASKITVSNTVATFQLAVLEGEAVDDASFAYFSDYDTLKSDMAASDYAPCNGETTKLTADLIPSAIYSWTGPDGFTSNLQNPILAKIRQPASGRYFLTVQVNDCPTIKDSLDIIVPPIPSTSVNKKICDGENFATHTTSGIYQDTLSFANGCDTFQTTNLTVLPNSTIKYSPTICEGQNFLGYSASGTYYDTLKIPSANGCDSIGIIHLTVLANERITIDTNICEGEHFEKYINQGIYVDTLQMKAANGCDLIRTINLTVIPHPVPDLGNQTIVCNNDSLILRPGQFSSYLWQDGSTDSTFTVRTSGTYTVTVTNDCFSASASLVVMQQNCAVTFPTAFTPNDDGRNDTFKPLHALNLSDYHLRIYNRWGQQVFESSNYLKGWNGMLNNKNAVAGTYVWYCTFKNPYDSKTTELKGFVVLIR